MLALQSQVQSLAADGTNGDAAAPLPPVHEEEGGEEEGGDDDEEM